VKRPPIWLLVGMASIGPLALNVFVPSIPGLVGYFASDLATVQLALSLYFIAIAAGQLVYGPLSDRFGRRPVLLWGLGIFAVASLACALAPSIEALLGARMLQAVGACAGMVMSRAIVRDVFDRSAAASAIGYITSAVAVVPALAPAIGGYLELWFGWRSSFLATFVFGAIVLIAAFPAAHETHHSRSAAPVGLGGYAMLLGSRVFLGYALNTSMTTAAYFAFLTSAPVLMIDGLGITPAACGLWFIPISGAYMVGNFLAGRYSRRLGLDRMIVIGSSAAVLCGLVLVTFAIGGVLTPLAVFVPCSLMAFANGLSQPNGIAAAISADPRLVGSASGLLGFLQMGLGALGTVLMGFLHDGTLMPLALVMTGLIATGLLVLRLAVKMPQLLPSASAP
jgi:DHA1 family bicyclomycin/chloramphenicol resistance-like MFS transporter